MKRLIFCTFFAFGILTANAQHYQMVCNLDSPWGHGQGERWTVPTFANGEADIRHNQEIAIFDAIGMDAQKFVLTFIDYTMQQFSHFRETGQVSNMMNSRLVISSAANTDYVVTVLDGKFVENQPIVWQKYKGSKNQQWKIKKGCIKGDFYLVSVQNPLFCIKANSTGEPAKPVIERHQRLKLHKLGNVNIYDKNAEWSICNAEDW